MHDSIWNKEECQTAIDEVILKTALSSLLEIEGRQLLLENEAIKNDPRFQLSAEVDRKIQRALKSAEIKQKLRVVGKKVGTFVRKVAVVFLAVFVGVTSTMAVSAEFRRVIYNLILSYDERYTQIEKSTDHRGFVDSDVYTWEHTFAPTKIPIGYEITHINESETIFTVMYESSNEKFMKFMQIYYSEGSGFTRVDTENARLIKSTFIGDSEALLVEKNGVTTITWQTGNFLLSIVSNEEPNTVIEVAENIKLLR